MRAATYARYSTDKQRETSIEDQDRRSVALAAEHGWSVVAQYHDEATSGSTPVASRPGGAQLLADALAGKFEVLIAEGLDRLSRDIGDQDRIVKRLEHLGIRIVGVADGYDSTHRGRKIHRIARGLINELYIDDLRAKIHRGQEGRVCRELLAGGYPYGYRTIAVPDGRRLEIDEGKAQWVLYIFDRYAAGWSTRRIAHELNILHVRSPKRGTWVSSAIYGSPKKGCGILNNPIYTGLYIWNRSQWVKDPDTDKRKRVERPEHEWRKVEMPALRIVPEDLWQAARARMRARPREGGRQPRTLLSGMLKCGICGGAVVAVSQYFYGCAARKDRGTHVCAGVMAPRRALEDQLIDYARTEMLSDESIAYLHGELQDWRRTITATAGAARRSAETRLATLQREIQNLVDAVAAHGLSDALRERLASAEAEKKRLTAELRAAQSAPPSEPVDVVERLRAGLDDLHAIIKSDPDEAREGIREIFGEVRLTPAGDEVIVDLSGFYEGMLAAISGGQIRTVVAGDRFLRSNQPPKALLRIKRRAA